MLSGQPIIILKENVERNRGREAQRSNIYAAKAISNAVRTTLGPRGMDKMLVSNTGDVTITNDGATILEEMSVQHPGAKMVIEVAKAQDEEVGDGTTTAVVLVGSLMEQAERLLTRKIHPTVIAKGYELGMTKALQILDELAIDVDPYDRKTLVKIADTSMTGKSIEAVKTKLNEIVVDAVMTIATKLSGKVIADEDDVLIKKLKGASMEDAELLKGVIIDKTRVSEMMPKSVKKAKVALLSTALEIKKTQSKAKIHISTTDQVAAFSAQEQETYRRLASSVIDSGANVLLCQKGIADPVQFFLAKGGVLAIEDVPEKDLKFAARALTATIVTKAEELNKEALGQAELVEQPEDAEVVRISGCKNPKTTTILLRGTTDYLLDELERATNDGIRVVMDMMEDGKYVVGGGAVETEMMLRLHEYAGSVGGREQLAVEAYAASFEIIPLTLAENSGFNTVDKITDLKHAHEKGKKTHAGLNVYTGAIVDMLKEGVIEPHRSKRQAIQSSAESAIMLVRIDDMMVSSNKPPAGR